MGIPIYDDSVWQKPYIIGIGQLLGRGLSAICTGRSDRLHDCRAQTVIEAIMWHGNPQSDARYSVEKFRELPKEDRDAVVKFIDAI